MATRQGWSGWDDYASYYDWENARTFGRRDVKFWQGFIRGQAGRLVELGCGTGRLLIPLAQSRRAVSGIDRSAAMLEHARRRLRRLPRACRPTLLRGDIRSLPLADASVGIVVAPYGILQSLLSTRDLSCAIAEASRVLRPGGLFGVDLVPDLPAWAEHGRRVQLSGTRRGRTVTLLESVQQDRRRRLTIFHETFVETPGPRAEPVSRRGSGPARRETRRRHFTLTFRTLPMPRVLRSIERAGFGIEATYGDYRGGPWSAESADAWIVVARKKRVRG